MIVVLVEAKLRLDGGAVNSIGMQARSYRLG